eukprot:TRINITY_DN73784_c0_g1_i1.p1 TRINITY_DN73784_c0_g1~~TRINITY_DN73784_c0_g1_i1.p1  ORF type:complete len:776 (-),score=221.93 TRINITY_DN73784_c0_g1_i1:53-2380(-)
MKGGLLSALLLLIGASRFVCAAKLLARANPIRKVVVMLQSMEKKITEEGRKAEGLYEKAMCFCKDGEAQLEASVKAAQEKIPNLESSIKEATSNHQQLSQDLKMHRQTRAQAEQGVETAVALRDKAAKAYAKESGDLRNNIKSLSEAVASLSSGAAGFLQASGVAVVRRLTLSMDMEDSARQVMASFLASNGQQGERAPSSEIVGILKQMKDEMTKELSQVEQQEQEDQATHDSLIEAKKKEIAAATKAVEAKTERVGDLAVRIVELRNDLENTKEGLVEDQKFLDNMDESCANKKAEWVSYQKTMAAEKVALADTIKLLNDDDALDLFKKTLPSASAAAGASASFLQVSAAQAVSRRKHNALRILRSRGKGRPHGDPRVSMLAIALRGQKQGFDMVVQKCDELVGILKVEQKDDDTKRDFCNKEIDKVEDEKKSFDRAVADRLTVIAQAEDSLKGLEVEIQALANGIRQLDTKVKEQTEQRKAEHEEHKELIASNSAAKSLLEVAKNRLMKFYNPRLSKEAPKRQLSEEDSIVVSMGGTAPPTPAPGGIAGTGISASLLQQQPSSAEEDDGSSAEAATPDGDATSASDGEAVVASSGSSSVQHDEGQEDGAASDDEAPAALLQVKAEADPGKMPNADLTYKAKSEESGGVMAMMDLLVADLQKEMTEAEVTEKDAQADYEKYMKDSSDKRMIDSKMISEKEATKAELKVKMHTDREGLRSEQTEVEETMKELSNLHRECDWLLANFQLRRDARAAEVDNIQRAKAVLSGADYTS